MHTPHRLRGALFAFVMACFLSVASCSTTVNSQASASGLSVSVDKSQGSYSITTAEPAWTFSGTVGAPLTDVATTSGRDKLGNYQETSFSWITDRPYQGTIRWYEVRKAVRFSITAPQATTKGIPFFPAFTAFPQNLHELSYRDEAMSPPFFGLKENGTPWIFFDDNADTAVLSAGNNFMVSKMHGDGTSLIACGLNDKAVDLPAGFTHTAWLAVGQGIESTVHAWGDLLTDSSGKTRTTDDADLLVKYLGYWTDNGTYYYYNYDKTLGYAGTIIALARHYRDANIPIHYIQLDSWWYQKTRTSPDGKVEGPKKAGLPEQSWNTYGGTIDYSASPDLFPQGLAAFQKQLGFPMVVHGRWIDPTSPYHKDYQISGFAAIDPRWWDDRMDYLAAAGVINYEQDWLNEIYKHSPEMITNPAIGPAFADNMARAAAAHGFTLQYCMPVPRFFLQGTNYENLKTTRVSGDRFERRNWNDFLYTSILADACRIRPWTDAFFSTEIGNLTISTLSSGPVGVGDAMGSESRENLMRAAREDGVIVKPDAPLLPTDQCIVADAAKLHKPLLTSTFTDNGQRTVYVLAAVRKGDTDQVSFQPASFGLTGPVYVYKTSAGAGSLIDASATYTDTLRKPDWDLYMIAPLGQSQIAFLGDAGKIVATGRQRIASIKDEPGRLTVQLTLTPAEKSVTLQGYATSAFTVSVDSGRTSRTSFDAATGLFSVGIIPDLATPSTVIDGDAVISVKVTLTKAK